MAKLIEVLGHDLFEPGGYSPKYADLVAMAFVGGDQAIPDAAFSFLGAKSKQVGATINCMQESHDEIDEEMMHMLARAISSDRGGIFEAGVQLVQLEIMEVFESFALKLAQEDWDLNSTKIVLK